ncbi:hypothetical protein [Burkholderia sp. GS2Y]|uniref:Uncharacterized protein n=1 Tax=Burkholderia theae TaxID=3143496 RepID=A0ABU9WM38_9BURK
MSTNWVSVRSDAISAAMNALGTSWSAVAGGATNQISLLVQTAQYIEQNLGSLSSGEASLLADQQKTALQNVLTAYAAIGIAAAQNAVAAVVDVILKDIPGLIGFA